MRKMCVILVLGCLVTQAAHAEWVNPQRLVNGQTYKLSKPTLFMKRFKPSTSVTDYKDVRWIPRNGTIKVRVSRMYNGAQWYYCDAKGVKDKKIGRGWVALYHLAGQELKPVVKKKAMTNKEAVKILLNGIEAR